MKFLDLFAGIGGFRLGMEQAGHECVGYVEWDKYARKSYEAIHNTEGEWTAHDITAVTDGDIQSLRGKGIDVICGGFPCQAFSVAGKRGGFDDTRGTLFFQIARFAKQIKPRLLFLENVKGLLSHDQGNTFGTILHTLDELGYDTEWQVLNSKNFGVPQNRERVFIVGHLRGTSGREVFPIRGTNRTTIQPYGQTQRSREWVFPTLYTKAHRGDATYISETNISAVLTPDREEIRQNGRRIKEPGEPMFTLTAQDRHGVMIEQIKEIVQKSRPNEEIGITFKENGDIRPYRMDERKSGISELNINHEDNISHTVISAHSPKIYGDSTNYRIRKLTPKECWRLQGFPIWAFDKAAEVNSDSQLYKQAGNSVTVNVIYEIAKRLGS